MELLRSYSKLPKPTIQTQTTRVERPNPAKPRSIRRRLSLEQVDALCQEYRLGATTRTISERYGIGKTAVTRLLREHDVLLRHRGLHDAQRTQAIQPYIAGQSVAQVASELGLHPSSVYDALRAAGVVFRSAHDPGRALGH